MPLFRVSLRFFALMCSEIVNITNNTNVKATPYLVAICLENRLATATTPSTMVVTPKPDRNLHAGQAEVERDLVFLIVPLVAQHQHAQRLQEEAPHHAERVRFAQHSHRRG